MTVEKDKELARRGRMAAIVIAGTGVFWILATIIGGLLGRRSKK